MMRMHRAHDSVESRYAPQRIKTRLHMRRTISSKAQVTGFVRRSAAGGQTRAQFFAVQAALKAGELLFDVGGATTTSRKHDLAPHWRNARTVDNHTARQ